MRINHSIIVGYLTSSDVDGLTISNRVFVGEVQVSVVYKVYFFLP